MKNRLILASVFFIYSFLGFGQTAEQIEQYKKNAEELVSFVEYMFNALGDDELSVSDKDVIVNQSYLKAFKDSKVQVEDDLIAGREVVTNKDVQAYLKDIDFFFEEVKFDLRIEEIRQGVNENEELFLTVKLNRHLQGTGINGDSINNNQTRFFEINIDQKQKDIRIVSIYTTKLNEEEELVAWWKKLAPEWRNLLGKGIHVGDGLFLKDVTIVEEDKFMANGQELDNSIFRIPLLIKRAQQYTQLDLSNNKSITEIEALYDLSDLKKLDISNTAISSLFPLRNLTTLEELNCSNTLVDDLDPLKYCMGLVKLNISNTNVGKVDVFTGFPRLTELYANNLNLDTVSAIGSCKNLTALSLENNESIVDFSFLGSLTNLTDLRLNGTNINDTSPLSSLGKITDLGLSSTKIKDLHALSEIKSLENLSINQTPIADIKDLESLSLKRVYCEGTSMERDEILDFIMSHPKTEVIFQTTELEEWWENMPEPWREVIFGKQEVEGDPTPETLHHLARVDSINISGNKVINDIKPLDKVLFLKKLDCSFTTITDLSPISEQKYLRKIDLSHSPVVDISPLRGADSLVWIRATSTNVESIEPLEGHKNLEYLNFDRTNVKYVGVINSLPSFRIGYFDQTLVTDEDVIELNYEGDEATMVYKTEHLMEWWGQLDDEWQNMFRKALGFNKVPNREEIHKLAGLDKFVVKSISIRDISAMEEFVRLRELRFNDTQIADISPLAKMKKLEILDCSRNPVSDLAPLSELLKLKVVHVENTQIKDIDPLSNMIQMESLKFSNTEVKDLKPLSDLSNLKELEFSNTRVKNIKPILDLPNLVMLKCFNNSISDKWIDEFKALHPNCEVVYY